MTKDFVQAIADEYKSNFLDIQENIAVPISSRVLYIRQSLIDLQISVLY